MEQAPWPGSGRYHFCLYSTSNNLIIDHTYLKEAEKSSPWAQEEGENKL